MGEIQLELFPDIIITPTPAMLSGRSTLWQCVNCGVLVCMPSLTSSVHKKPGSCPCCSHEQWSMQRYAGPFQRKGATGDRA